MRMLFGMFDAKMLCSKTTALDVLNVQSHARKVQRIDACSNDSRVQTRVNQCRDGHVTADPCGTIKIRNTHAADS
jgi:hypothetical protein